MIHPAFTMIINLLLSLIPLISTESKEKCYIYLYGTPGETIEDVYDFEYRGLYYEFAGEGEVNLVRKSTLKVPMAMECLYEEILDIAYNSEINRCYTGDIVVPDSVEFEDKKYRVASVNQHAFSFSKDLRSVVFNSNVDFPIDHYDYSTFGHFYMCKDLQKVVYHDSLTVLDSHLGYCSNLQEIHYPSKLTSITSSFNDTELTEFVLSNQDGYKPSRFYIRNSFRPLYKRNAQLPEFHKITYPKCDTLHLRYSYSYYDINSESEEYVVIRPCKHIILDLCDFPFYRMVGIKSIRVISQAETPPEILLINQIDRETVYRDNAVLYVPDEAMEAYREAYYWRDFGEIRPMSEYLREENAAVDRPVCEAAEMAEPQISLRSDRGELRITASTPAEVTVWSLQGLPLWRGTVMNEAAVTLPAGVYIVTTPTSSRKYSLKF